MQKERLDVLLVKKGFFDSRQKAQVEIIAGNVIVNDNLITKPGTLIQENSIIRIKEKSPYVSRGAYKLIHALDYFNINPENKICIDIGASTGGFTQVLLERGAKLVYAVDSGTNQLDWKIRNDSRVKSFEKLNARYIDEIQMKNNYFIPEPELATIDVSFISLTKIVPPLIKIMKKPFEIISLIKPQFELEPEYIGKKGIAKKEFIHLAIEKIINLGNSLDLKCSNVIESPITGQKSGNIEYLIVMKD